MTNAELLVLALLADDIAEDNGMPADDRQTCWTCQSWADHSHELFTGRKITDVAL